MPDSTGGTGGPVRYSDVLGDLRAAYDARAGWRNRLRKQPWKLAERAAFLARLQDDGGGRLLEIGAGTGQDSMFFARHGIEVVATDLSPAMVGHCRAKGLDARVMDVMRLDFPAGSFDAVYALNCLLHVPNADLPRALAVIHRLLRPGGWLYLGVWGGESSEGPTEGDQHEPARFFSFRTDEQIKRFASEHFTVADFHVVEPGGGLHFQSLTLRRG